MLVLALTWLVPKANAAGYEYTVTAASDWGQTFTNTQLTNSQTYFSAAVSNNYMYSVPAPSETNMMKYAYSDPDYAPRIFRLLTAQEYFTFPTNATYFPYPGYKGGSITSFSGYFYMGPAHAADTKGNLYISHYSVDASAYSYVWADPIGAITAFSVDDRPIADASNSYLGSTSYKYQSNATPTTIILDPTYNGTVTSSDTNYRITYRSDVMSAYGDGLGGTGYLWFAPNNGGDDVTEIYDKIECIILSSGKITGKKIFNVPEVNTTRSRVVQYADNKLLYNNQATGKLYKGTLNASSVADASSVIWTDLGLTNQGTGATMFMLADRELLAYSSTTTAFQIVDVTDVNNKYVVGTYSPFTTASGSNQTRGHFINVSNVDDYNANIYIFVPKVGTEKYTINVTPTDPVQNLAINIVKDQDPEQLSRQDAVLTWEAPASGEVASYTIYRSENPWYSMAPNSTADYPLATQYTFSDWAAIGTTTGLTYTDIDVCMYGSETSRTYKYKVIPTFADGGFGAESDVVEITPPLVPFVPIWDTTMDQDDIKGGIDRYDGYCKVQLYWKFPQVNNYNYFPSGQKNVYGVKPDYYSILRDGKVIVPYTTTYNYIDTDVKSEHTYTYQVVSHYDNYTDTAVSTPNSIYVAKRDWAKVGYELTEIYNYKIAASGDSVHIPASSYSNMAASAHSYYKQAAYHNGYWYVAQCTNADKTNGGIIKISAAAPWENKTENVLTSGTAFYQHSTHYSTSPASRNIGIATDYEGNLFIQSGSVNFSGTLVTSSYFNRIAEGKVFIKGDNGSYTTYTVDLSGIDLTEYNEYDKSKYLTTAPGRCDFYTMGGNLKSDGYAYLYLATSVSKAAFVIKLTYTGSAVTATLVNKLQDTEGRRTWNGEPFLQNNENLVIPVNCTGRQGEFLHLIRSSALSLWSRNDNSELATRKTNVYDTQSRVNTPGGCTLEFNGELFLITPTSQYSVNKGNFYIGMAERGDGDTPTTADFGHIIPVTMWQQTDAEDGGGSSSGTVSIFAEVGEEDINGDGELNDYAYIYLYSPSGPRFAKYRLTPSNAFPPTQVTLNVAPIYAEDYVAGTLNPGGDIERFDATASWLQVTDYGTTEGGNVFYNIQSYTLQLVDAEGTPISEKDESGNLLFPAIEFDVDNNGEPTTVYTVTFNANGVKTKTSVSTESEFYKNLTWRKVERTDENGNAETDTDGNVIQDIEYSYVYKDVKKGFDYTALVTVNYVGVDESNTGAQQSSPKTEWEAADTYQPEEATGTVLVDIKKNNWSDWDVDYYGNPAKEENDPDDAYFDKYRVCLKLANPIFKDENGNATTVYPRSYYTIGIDKNKDGIVDQEITEFKLFIGIGNEISTKEFKTMSTTVADADGYIDITDGQIPGDYDFDQSTSGKPHVYWDMLDYTAPASYDDGVTYTDTDNPSTWNYIVTTTYAAGNTRISEAVTSPMAADNGGITTGVEVISTQAVLNVYPIPATISVTIKSSEAIEAVEIYSTSGLLVKTVEGNADHVMTVDVSDLASGYYFMRVNNLAPVRIIKN